MAEIDRPQAERSPLLPNPSRTPAENPELVYTNKKEREFLERRQAAQQKLDDDIRRAENLAYGEKDANGNIVRLGGTAAQIQEWQRQLDEMSGFGLVSSWSSIIGTKKALRGQIEAEKRLLAEQTKRIEEMKQERAELAKKFEQFDNLAKEAAKKTDTSKNTRRPGNAKVPRVHRARGQRASAHHRHRRLSKVADAVSRESRRLH